MIDSIPTLLSVLSAVRAAPFDQRAAVAVQAGLGPEILRGVLDSFPKFGGDVPTVPGAVSWDADSVLINRPATIGWWNLFLVPRLRRPVWLVEASLGGWMRSLWLVRADSADDAPAVLQRGLEADGEEWGERTVTSVQPVPRPASCADDDVTPADLELGGRCPMRDYVQVRTWP